MPTKGSDITLKTSAENGASIDGRPRQLLLGLRIDALDGRHVERARQVVDDGVEERLDTLVLEGGPEQHGRDRARERARAERATDHLGRHRLLVEEVRLHELVVELRDRVDEQVVMVVGPIGELGGDLRDREGLAEIVLVGDRGHLDQVDDAPVVLFLPDRDLDADRVRAEPVAHRLHGGEEVRAGTVHLVDERDARDAVAVGLAPDGLGLRLHSGDRVEHGHGAVEDAQ